MTRFGSQTVFGAIIAALAALSPAAAEEAAEVTPVKFVHCEIEYVIQPGDTLNVISEIAYGANRQQLIFARNWDIIDMLGTLPAGKTIIIPCASGDAEYTPDEERLDEAMMISRFEAAERVAKTPIQPGRQFRLLTADGQAPYVDRMLRKGGFFAELIEQALAEGPLRERTNTIFVNDRNVHLKELLEDGSFDIGFPWLNPHCEYAEKGLSLSAQDEYLCETFEFSKPVYEAVSGFFVAADRIAQRGGFDGFVGQRICTPEGDSLSTLAQEGLTPETASFTAAKTPADCIALLDTGEVDAVVADSIEAEQAIADRGATARIAERTDLSTLKTLHAIAPRNKPEAVAALHEIDSGIATMRDRGDWFRIVGAFLAAQ